MKRLFFILSLSYASITICSSQTSVWKVEGKGTSLYLGGTIHMLTPQDYPLPPEFDSAYIWTDVLVLEADIDKMQDPEVVQKMMAMATYHDDRTLKSELSEEVYNLLEKECEALNISLAELSKFKPSMVVLLITVTKMQQSGSTSPGVDQYYLTKAKSDNKALSFLETVDSQLELLFGGDEDNDDELVMQSLDNMDDMDKMSGEINFGWRNGKKKVFIDILKEMRKDYPDIYKKLVVDRNSEWLPVIESYLDNNKTEFVLAGSLHMHGSEGILALLKKKGYKISQLKL